MVGPAGDTQSSWALRLSCGNFLARNVFTGRADPRAAQDES